MKSSLFLFLIFIASQLLAQDLIVKTNGDSLNCLITRNENSYMYFNQIVNHRFKRDSLALANIKTFKTDYYTTKKTVKTVEEKPAANSTPITIQPYNTEKKDPKSVGNYAPSYKKERNFFLSMSSGFSNRIVALPNNLNQRGKDFFKDVLQGGVLCLDGGYFINEEIGLGFQVHQHISNAVIENVSVLVDSVNNIRVVGDYELKIRINYFGPTFFARKTSENEKHVLIGTGSLGYTHYSENEYFVETVLTTVTGGNIGLSIGGQYHLMLDPHLAIGLGVNYHQAQIVSYTFSSGANSITISDAPINTNRYDIKLLLAYWF